MADEITPEVRTQRMKEFMTMLPLTMELAGLPKCQPGGLFSESQMELRVTVLRNAYKLARQLVKEIGETGGA